MPRRRNLKAHANKQGDRVAAYEYTALTPILRSAPSASPTQVATLEPRATPTTGATAAPAQAARLQSLDEAERLLSIRDFFAASGMLEGLVHPLPGNTSPLSSDERIRALSNLGYAYNERKLYFLAYNVLNEALDLQPEFYEALVNRAFANVGRGSYDLAEQDLRHAQRLAQSMTEKGNVSNLLGQLADMRGGGGGAPSAGGRTASGAPAPSPNAGLDAYLKNQERINRENCARAASGALVACTQ